MKKSLTAAVLALTAMTAGQAGAEQVKGLNVVVTSQDRQTQMMAMVLSTQTAARHGKDVNLVLCSHAADLALAETTTEPFQPLGESPTDLLKNLISLGVNVEVCPLYLPSVGKTEDALIDGISVANPAVVAGRLLDTEYRVLSY